MNRVILHHWHLKESSKKLVQRRLWSVQTMYPLVHYLNIWNLAFRRHWIGVWGGGGVMVCLSFSIRKCVLCVKRGAKMACQKDYIYIEGYQPEWYISTMIYSGDTPFWSETLDIFIKKNMAMRQDLQLDPVSSGGSHLFLCNWLQDSWVHVEKI